MGSRFFLSVPLAALTFLLPASPVTASQWIADRDIASYCQQYLTRPESPSGAVCLSYIQGFLDGLRTTETPAFPLPRENGDEINAEEAAAVSAARMQALVEEYGPPARAGICLPHNLSRNEVTRVIARALRYGRSSGRSALDDYAQIALQERYPCDTRDPVENQGQDTRLEHEVIEDRAEESTDVRHDDGERQ